MKKLLLTPILTLALMLMFPGVVYAATFAMQPTTGQYLHGGCANTVQVYANATGQSSNSADLILNFNPSRVQILDSDPNQAGIQIRPGNAYQAFISNQVDNNAGQIIATAISFSDFLSSNKLFATIEFVTIGTPDSAQFDIFFTGPGQTKDSNIASATSNLDLLSSATDGNYTFVAGSCEPDTQKPTVTYVAPTSGQSNFGLNSDIQIGITDNSSGLDLSSLSITLNNVTYESGDPRLGFSGSSTNYSITLNPSDALPADQASTIVIIGSDEAGNSFVSQNTFNIPASAPASDGGDVVTVPDDSNVGGDVSCDCAELTSESIVYIPGPGQLLENTIFQDTVVERVVVQAVNDLGVTGSGALVSAFLLSLSFIPYLSFINAPGLLLNAFGFFAGRNRNRSWGFIVDHVTGKPISFATCRVYLQGASGFVTQTVSDAEGRYGFVLNPGKYRLEVIHSGYAKFTGDIKIEEDESTYVYDVSLRPKGLASEEIRRRYNVLSDLVLNLKKAWAYLRPLLFAFGILLSVLSILVKPVLLNWIIFAAYIIIIGLFLYRKLSKRSSHASVVDAETGLRVPGAIVKIFDPKKWEVIDTQITNSNGMFDYWGEPGNYAILVTARGYRFPSASQTGVNYTKYGKAKLMKARLKKGRNALQIYVDPTERVERGDQTEESGYNDASPFSE